ncbi:replicative DNA helicase [Dysgonomonas sp. ZJ279]|uniref:replicative DNA helicase n=1 Tax=Dysgonomonas sp. ZJ279 TaxID=2709796 RepID=UPI0013EA7C03|nr:replicative DNA helicase [Dysgonomonas sp. ZJ279]
MKNRHKNNSKNQQLLISEPLGKIQPQSIELESAILGALLMESKAYQDIEDILTSDDFYTEIHQIIFKAIFNLSGKRKPIDILTVVEELKAMGELEFIGGPLYIAELTEKVASSAHIIFHAQIIKQKSQARKLIRITSEIQAKAFDETQDIAETIECLEKSFTELVTSSTVSKSIGMPEALTIALDKAAMIQKLKQNGIQIAIPTGLHSLDEVFAGGWMSPDLIVLGARPSMGKTQNALSFAKAASMNNKDVFFVSIEMTATQLVNRFLLEDNRINGYNLRTGQMNMQEWAAMDERAKQLWDMKLNIGDDHNIRYLNNIKSEARRLKRKDKLDVMIIDYLGLIKTNLKFASRYLEIGYITGELKNLTKELDIPIILLSQLSRPIKGVAVKEPQLEDLRESGDIEQDADIVLFIHKPDYYDSGAIDSKNEPWKGRGKIIISKYREGARNNSVIFYHDDRYKKIWDNPQPKTSP